MEPTNWRCRLLDLLDKLGVLDDVERTVIDALPSSARPSSRTDPSQTVEPATWNMIEGEPEMMTSQRQYPERPPSAPPPKRRRTFGTDAEIHHPPSSDTAVDANRQVVETLQLELQLVRTQSGTALDLTARAFENPTSSYCILP